MRKTIKNYSNCIIGFVIGTLFTSCAIDSLEETTITIEEEIAVSINSEITTQEIITDFPYWVGIYLYPAWNKTPRFPNNEIIQQFNLYDPYIVGPQDPSYNCIAWSIEEFSFWLDYPLYAGLEEFVEFYTQMQHSYHRYPTSFRPNSSDAPSGVIDLFANGNTPTHASRRTNDARFPDYFESKLGSSYTLRDIRSAVTGGIYGYQFLTMEPINSIPTSKTQIETIKALVKEANPNIIFTPSDVDIVKQEVEKDTSLKNQFETLFEKWKYEWNHGYMQFSNNTRDVVSMQEFKDLIALGKSIIPFVVEKMLDRSNFFAVRLYEELQDDKLSPEERKAQLKAKIATNKKILYQSVQNEAAIVAQEWINQHKKQ
jgi:hypothetical protein